MTRTEKIQMRPYITDNGYEMMLPVDDERVMTTDELIAKYARPVAAPKNPVCPKCHTHCYGDCESN